MKVLTEQYGTEFRKLIFIHHINFNLEYLMLLPILTLEPRQVGYCMRNLVLFQEHLCWKPVIIATGNGCIMPSKKTGYCKITEEI